MPHTIDFFIFFFLLLAPTTNSCPNLTSTLTIHVVAIVFLTTLNLANHQIKPAPQIPSVPRLVQTQMTHRAYMAQTKSNYAIRFFRRTRKVLAPNGSSSNAPAITVVGSGTATMSMVPSETTGLPNCPRP